MKEEKAPPSFKIHFHPLHTLSPSLSATCRTHALLTPPILLLVFAPLSLSLSLSLSTTTAMLEEAAISVLSIWTSMNSWLSSTLLFLLLNLMIFTIAYSSGFTSLKPPHNHHSDTHHNHSHHLQTQLTRTPSILQRLKSLNFYNYIPTPHHEPPINQPLHHPPPPPPPSTTVAPETDTHLAEDPKFFPEEDKQGPTMDEIYSRIIQGKTNNTAHYGRQNSDTKPAGGEIPVRLPRKIKKSASDKSAFSHFAAVEERENAAVAALVVEEEEQAEEVDARADDFINKFREKLKMQRLDSINKSTAK